MYLSSTPVVAAYLVGVVGVRMFSDHKPFSVNPYIMVVYNFTATILSTITAALFLYSLVASDVYYDFALKLFWLSKIYELLDTVFMLLRSKYDQVSLLHVYHHSSMVLLTEWLWTYHPILGVAVPSFLNSTVHIVMYTYYALSAMNVPCPWKRYLTQFQLTQFALLIMHGIYGIFSSTDRVHVYGIYVAYELSMLACFLSFYFRTYGAKKGQSSQKEKKSN